MNVDDSYLPRLHNCDTLDKPAEIIRHREALNRLVTLAKTAPSDTLPDMVWQVGVMERAH